MSAAVTFFQQRLHPPLGWALVASMVNTQPMSWAHALPAGARLFQVQVHSWEVKCLSNRSTGKDPRPPVIISFSVMGNGWVWRAFSMYSVFLWLEWTFCFKMSLTPMGISLCSKRPRPCKNMVVPTLLRDFPQLHLNIGTEINTNPWAFLRLAASRASRALGGPWLDS